MDKEFKEHRLAGGNTNTVVRIGDTVRRSLSPHSETIHAFLRHLESKGFPASRFKGIDSSGREILSFIDGDAALPNQLWRTEAALVAAAKLLRSLHDASLDLSPPEPASWAFKCPDDLQVEVICHNDFAPYNLVFDAGVPIAVLDFDLCGPGPRCRDFAYLAYWMVPLSFSSKDLQTASRRDLASGSGRFALICDAYGYETRREVVKMVSVVLHQLADVYATRQLVGEHATEELLLGNHFEHWSREASSFDDVIGTLAANIGF